MTAAVPANTAGAATRLGMVFNKLICMVVGGVPMTGGLGTVTGMIFGTLTFGIMFQGTDFATFDKDLDLLPILVLPLIGVLMNDTFRKLATSASSTRRI